MPESEKNWCFDEEFVYALKFCQAFKLPNNECLIWLGTLCSFMIIPGLINPV